MRKYDLAANGADPDGARIYAPHTQDYDRGLLGTLLERAGVSTEEFVVALVGAIQPYALMMAELAEFFERNDVRGTGEGLRMRFRFEDASEELSFDLKHFREWLKAWEEVRAAVEAIGWDVPSLWQLSRCFDDVVSWEERRNGPREPAAKKWIAKNTYPERKDAREHWASPLPPTPPPVGDAEVDEWVTRLHSVLVAVAQACRPYGNYEALEAAARQQSDDTASSNDVRGRGTVFADWSARELQALENDYFTGSFAAALWIWIEQLRRLAPHQINARARPVIECLTAVFDSRPRTVVETTRQMETLVEFLNLPIWKRRHSLYQAWLIPVIEKALGDYPVEIHHNKGVLRLGFAETHVATFATEHGEIRLVSEQKAKMAKPTLRRSRSENVQPDYVLIAGDRPESTLVVIETKQYLRPSIKNFAEALSDYGEAHPEATVIIADYGPMAPSVLASVEPNVASRARAIGDVRPRSTEALRELQHAIRDRMPPCPGGSVAEEAAVSGVDLIVVDVSASMDLDLASPRVLDELRILAKGNPAARWLAVDTAIRFSGAGSEALDAVLKLSRDGSTLLRSALAAEDLQNAVVITDEDGRAEFVSGDVPRVLGVVGGGTLDWVPLPPKARLE